MPKDYDRDGVVDINDQCPTLYGEQSSFGCPSGYLEKQAASLARLDSLEGLLLKLKTKMENLNTDIATLNKLKVERKTITDVTKPKEKETPVSPPETKEVKPVIVPETKTKPGDIEIVKDKTYAYYVVTISALNEHVAVAEAKKIKPKYPNVKVIAQPNGFFRTAIYSGIDKQEAVKLLETVTENGTKQAWIAFY